MIHSVAECSSVFGMTLVLTLGLGAPSACMRVPQIFASFTFLGYVPMAQSVCFGSSRNHAGCLVLAWSALQAAGHPAWLLVRQP